MIATGMVVLTVVIHGVGLAGMGRVFHAEETGRSRGRLSVFSPRGLGFMIAIALALFFLHGVEIWLYAALYNLLDAVPDFRTAVYFSTATYGTVGYDDSALDPKWLLIGGIEGINGMLLLGWSTAFFVTVITRLRV